jgi:hypothetical protein
MADVVQRARTFTEDSVRPGSAWRAEALSLIIELADEVEKLANVIIDGAVAGYKREIETERTTTVNYSTEQRIEYQEQACRTGQPGQVEN